MRPILAMWVNKGLTAFLTFHSIVFKQKYSLVVKSCAKIRPNERKLQFFLGGGESSANVIGGGAIDEMVPKWN